MIWLRLCDRVNHMQYGCRQGTAAAAFLLLVTLGSHDDLSVGLHFTELCPPMGQPFSFTHTLCTSCAMFSWVQSIASSMHCALSRSTLLSVTLQCGYQRHYLVTDNSMDANMLCCPDLCDMNAASTARTVLSGALCTTHTCVSWESDLIWCWILTLSGVLGQDLMRP